MKFDEVNVGDILKEGTGQHWLGKIFIFVKSKWDSPKHIEIIEIIKMDGLKKYQLIIIVLFQKIGLINIKKNIKYQTKKNYLRLYLNEVGRYSC